MVQVKVPLPAWVPDDMVQSHGQPQWTEHEREAIWGALVTTVKSSLSWLTYVCIC